MNVTQRGPLPVLLCLLLAAPAFAAWELDTASSSVNFISVKNASVAEAHHFRAFRGTVSDDGAARLRIDLDSVETLVPIRNQRMREMLFETIRFPQATLAAQVPAVLLDMEAGTQSLADLDIDVTLHGMTQRYAAPVLVTRLGDGSLQVVLRRPILLKAEDFGLAAGVGMLREVAGLKSISTAIPVSAQLLFRPVES